MKKALHKYKHALWLLYLPVYFFSFFLAESSITTQYWVSYTPLDDKIPFVEEFVIAYIAWFPAIWLTGLFYCSSTPKRSEGTSGPSSSATASALSFSSSSPTARTSGRGPSASPMSLPTWFRPSIPMTRTQTCCPACTSSARRRSFCGIRFKATEAVAVRRGGGSRHTDRHVDSIY